MVLLVCFLCHFGGFWWCFGPFLGIFVVSTFELSLRDFVFFGIFLAFFLPGLSAFLVSVVVVLFFAFLFFSRPKFRKIVPSTPETNVSDSETLVFDVKSAFSIVFGILKEFHFLYHFGVFSGDVFGIFVVFILDFFSSESCFSGCCFLSGFFFAFFALLVPSLRKGLENCLYEYQK